MQRPWTCAKNEKIGNSLKTNLSVINLLLQKLHQPQSESNLLYLAGFGKADSQLMNRSQCTAWVIITLRHNQVVLFVVLREWGNSSGSSSLLYTTKGEGGYQTHQPREMPDEYGRTSGKSLTELIIAVILFQVQITCVFQNDTAWFALICLLPVNLQT